MITLLAAVSGAALGFVAGCLWENGRPGGSDDLRVELLRRKTSGASGFSSSFPAAPQPPGARDPGGTQTAGGAHEGSAPPANLLNDPVDTAHVERIERAKGDE